MCEMHFNTFPLAGSIVYGVHHNQQLAASQLDMVDDEISGIYFITPRFYHEPVETMIAEQVALNYITMSE